jgi:hypothetical protein
MKTNNELNNKITAILAATIGLFMFLNQIFPELQNNLNTINTNLIQLIPPQYQNTTQTLLTLLSITIAIIVYTYNYTTSKAYAKDYAKEKIKKYKNH